VGLNLPRPPFFQKELEFTVSSSLGPGRFDPSYEERGVDYPLGHVRWTVQRNMEAVLDQIAAGKLPVERLTTHRFPIDWAGQAYELVTSRAEPFMGIVLQYTPTEVPPLRRVELVARRAPAGEPGVSFIGSGNFARLVLMPALERVGGFSLRGLCTARGLNAEHTGRSKGFDFATTDAGEIWRDEATRAVFIATRHDLHAGLVIDALRAGKHVFVEKPLCIKMEELAAIEATVQELGASCPILMVGLNRRFAPATMKLRRFLEGANPLSIMYRFAPGALPRDHWTHDEEVGGGRIVGEACHAIDTCVALAGSPPVRVHAESVGHQNGVETTDDRVLMTLRHANGSISSVSYQAGGDKAFPAERIEVFGGGRTAIIENWDRVELWRGGRLERARGGKDKGHASELEAFMTACRNGGPWPVRWADTRAVASATLLAVRSLREGLPQDVANGS
jgi:predicted dehydrogenase